jgi:hypothetical protein
MTDVMTAKISMPEFAKRLRLLTTFQLILSYIHDGAQALDTRGKNFTAGAH